MRLHRLSGSWAHLTELGRSHSRKVELRLGCAPFCLALALQAAHSGEPVLGTVETLAVGLEAVAGELVAAQLEADSSLHDAHSLRAVRTAKHGGLIIIPTARAGAAVRVFARLGGNVHAFWALVVLAEAAHAVSRVSEVGLFFTTQRLAPERQQRKH